MTKNPQILYINLDDSGKLVEHEKVAVYAGLLFTSKLQKDKFITQYRSIIQQIRCHYCKQNPVSCMQKNCPEVKHNMLKAKHNRRIINYIKKYSCLCCIIQNGQIYPKIKQDKASRGRYLDFALKLLIKRTIQELIKNKVLRADKPLNLVINIDEQTTKTNGYYNLKDGIIEELKFGIHNYNYNAIYSPILTSDLNIKLCYQKSDKNFLIQASDLIAGTVRRAYLDNLNDNLAFRQKISFIDYTMFLP